MNLLKSLDVLMDDNFEVHFTFHVCEDYLLDLLDVLFGEFFFAKSISVDKYLTHTNYLSPIVSILHDYYAKHPLTPLVLQTIPDWVSDLVAIYSTKKDTNDQAQLLLYLNESFVEQFYFIGVGLETYQNLYTSNRYNVQAKFNTHGRLWD